MKIVYILEAKWHDSIGRCRKNELVGVYDDLTKLEQAKNKIEITPHDYKSITFGINKEIQPFGA